MPPRPLLAAACMVLLAPSALSQVELPPGIAQTTWTMEHGLPQDSVSGIAEDADGYLWVATFGGLARFDGVRFEVFDVGTNPELGGSRFRRACALPDGTTWFQSEGFGQVRYRDGEFERFPDAEPVYWAGVDAKGETWITLGTGVHRLRGDETELVWKDLGAVMITRRGILWGHRDQELVRVDGDHVTTFGREDGLPSSRYRSLVEGLDGVLWIATDTGLWRSTDATKTRFVAVPEAPESIIKIVCDNRGMLWMLADEELVCWDPHTSTQVRVPQGEYDRLLTDSRGNVWAASFGGLHSFHTTPLQDATAALGSRPRSFWTVGGDGRGRLLAAGNAFLISALDGVVEHQVFGFHVRAVLVDRAERLWLGTGPHVTRIEGDERTRLHKGEGENGESRALLETADGRLWLGATSGLYRLEGERFVQVHPEIEHAVSLLEEPSGALWIGGRGGLARLEDEELSWITHDEGLAPGVVRTLHRDSDGVLWVGTYGGGLSRIAGDRVFRFSRANGLVDDHLACILEDDDGRFWINSNRGPFVVRRADLNAVARGEAAHVTCISFSRSEGAREANGGSQPAGWRGPDGRMWFPHIEGVTVADPRELPLDEAPPRVVVEALELGQDRRLDARFTALGFSSPGRVRIQYRLVGENPDWIEAGTDRSVHYAYVRPGRRTFELRARNGYGPWSEVVSKPVKVPHRFTETRTFFVGVVLAACLLTLGVARVQVRRARARADELARTQTSLSRSQAELRRLSRDLLSAQEKERQRISAELHDDVTQRLAALAIQAELVEARLGQAGARTREQLHDMAAMAQQLAGDVQQLSRRLHPVGLRTLGLAEAIRQECDAFTRRGGIPVELEDHVASDEVGEDVATAAFRIFQESLHNVEKHAGAGAVNVSVELVDGDLVVSIADTGRGFDRRNGEDDGLGLVTMKERAASVGGRLTIDSHPGDGTTVELRAPVTRRSS